jgi:hypothetical protein
MDAPDSNRQMLRHTVATLAYRAGKALRDTTESFGNYALRDKVRSPLAILAHMGDLFDWALSCAKGKQEWRDSAPLHWPQEVERFFKSLKAFDDYLASNQALGYPAEKLFQGPVADALTHTGQLTMLRRSSGFPMRSENYMRADIVAGRVGTEQTPPSREY